MLAGITITSLAVPQGISYANLAGIPPIIGLCEISSFLYFYYAKSVLYAVASFEYHLYRKAGFCDIKNLENCLKVILHKGVVLNFAQL